MSNIADFLERKNFNGNFRNEFTKILRAPLRMIFCRIECCLPPSQTLDNNTVAAAGSLSSVAVRSSTPAFHEQIDHRHPDGQDRSRIDLAHQQGNIYAAFVQKKLDLLSRYSIYTGYTEPLFNSLDVEMIDDVDTSSPNAAKHSFVTLWKGDDGGNMETHL